jgi:hypothetical protein
MYTADWWLIYGFIHTHIVIFHFAFLICTTLRYNNLFVHAVQTTEYLLPAEALSLFIQNNMWEGGKWLRVPHHLKVNFLALSGCYGTSDRHCFPCIALIDVDIRTEIYYESW